MLVKVYLASFWKMLVDTRTLRFALVALAVAEFVAVGYYFSRTQVYSAGFVLELSPQVSEVISLESLRNYFSSRDFRVQAGGHIDQVETLDDNRIHLTIASQNFQELQLRAKKIRDILKSGLPTEQAKLVLTAAQTLGRTVDELGKKITGSGKVLQSLLAAESQDLSPMAKTALAQSYGKFYDSMRGERPSAAAANRSLSSAGPMTPDLINVYEDRLAELKKDAEEEMAEAAPTISKAGLDDGATKQNALSNQSDLSIAIVDNVVRSFFAREHGQAVIGTLLGTAKLALTETEEARALGYSFPGMLLLGFLLATFVVLATNLVQTILYTEYDTPSKLRYNYSFEKFHGVKHLGKFLDKELKICLDPGSSAPQRIVAATMGSNTLSSRALRTFAQELVKTGAKVLIIDLFRDPSPLVLESDLSFKDGLWNYIYENIPLKDCIYRTGGGDLFFMPPGAKCTMDAELVDHSRFRKLLVETDEFDVVIFSGSFDNVADLAKISYFSNAVYFFSEKGMLRAEIHTRILRLFAVYNGMRRYLITFSSQDELPVSAQASDIQAAS